jgi:hypothetical protein
VLVFAFVVFGPVRFVLRDKVLAELRSSLIDRHSVANNFCRTSSCIWKLASLHPGILEGRYAINCVEETEKSNWLHGSAEGLSEGAHILQEELLLFLFFNIPFLSALP